MQICSQKRQRAPGTFVDLFHFIISVLAQFLIFQMYLQQRLVVDSLLARHWLQLVLVIMAAMSSVSRVTDNRHHPSDVWAGAGIGIFVALLASLKIPDVEVS